MYSFPYLEPVCCSTSSSNCFFLTYIQISQKADQVVWYSHLLKNFLQFVVIHTVKVFGIVNKAEVDVFLELSCFSMIQWILTIWSLVPLPFLNPAWTSGRSQFTYCWSLAWRILSITSMWDQRRQWHPTPVLLPGKSHGWRSLEGCSPWGRWGLDTTEWLHFHFSLSCIGEGNGNPLQCSCLENPRDGGAWWAAV